MVGVSRDMRMAYARARADYTDMELLDMAILWHTSEPVLAWQFREAWAIRCVEGKEMIGHGCN